MYCLITTGNLYAIKEGDLIAFIPESAALPREEQEEKYFVHSVLYEDELFCHISRLGIVQAHAYQQAARAQLLDGSWYLIS